MTQWVQTVAVKPFKICILRTNIQVHSLTDTVILLEICAHPDVAETVKEPLNAMQWEVLRHAAYSLDLSPCSVDVFGPLQKTLKACTITNYDDVQEAVVQW